MFYVHFFKANGVTTRPVSCSLKSYKEALEWVRKWNETPEGEYNTSGMAFRIVKTN